ncbi:MAG: 1,4-dihydroxy-2-naphthoate polyprenyltransferase [Candidatus Hydrogenedentes bacterium]|nr:1,4-dihydroxy-2-naphthoate polyprenyltransferase [Candidatus Hydrogenedentota bacterium]
MAKYPCGIWIDAARPHTLAAAASPVLIGTALAAGENGFHGVAAIAALLGALLIQIGANYANDYYDYLKGADRSDRIGPQRATQAGLVTPRQMRLATAVALGLAILPGLYLVYRGGWPILLIGVLSLLFAVLYTGGPLPLGYIGAADLFVLVFFGPVAVAGTYYVQTLTLCTVPILAGLATGLISMAILTVNNLRDIEQDRQAGKKTLAVRFGISFARWEYLIAMMTALVIVPLWVCTIEGGRRGVLAACVMVLPALVTTRTVFTKQDGSTLNACLAATGKILLGFSLLFSGGWLLWK